jgi:2-polyprenyl-3-methyl-5-hydroxy-6-metoxy-1,4-benzoquinol methylase
MDVVERLTLEAAQADTMLACEHRHRYELAAGLLAGRRVLDLCCGSGYGSAILSAGGAAHVTGVDNDAATVETARSTVAADGGSVEFEAAEAVAFLRGAIGDRFDAVVCFEGLEHLPDLDGALELLRDHARQGMRVIASVPNDKLTGVHNQFHVTEFGYDDALAAFAGFPELVLLPQFLAEGSVICSEEATDVDVEVTLEDRREPEYANHFIFCSGFSDDELRGVHRGRIQVNVSPVFNRWSEDLKQGAWALRRENARLARSRLGKAGSAAASALNAVSAREARLAELTERYRAAEARLAEVEATLASRASADPEPEAPVRVRERVEAVPARPLEPDPGTGEQADPASRAQANPNSWELRRRRAAEVLIPWIEQTAPLAGRTVLEYGCGNGAVSSAFAARCERLIGIDIDAGAIAEARSRLAALGTANAELERHPVEEVLEATRRHAGEVDVFLLYAVLEHMTVTERLALLRVAREVIKADGAIIICETPNRLIWFDHHTAQMPFFHLLPDELALELADRVPRPEVREALAAAAGAGREPGLEAVARWGRGVSFHELAAVFGEDLGRHVIASSYDPVLFGERPIHPEETALARYLSRAAPALPPAFSRYWLDLILSPSPVQRRPPQLRPWTAETLAADGVAYTAWENLLFQRPGAALTVTLPQPTQRVVVGSVTLDGRWLDLALTPHGSPEAWVAEHRAPAREHAFSTFRLEAPVQQFRLRASDECHVVFVGYEE